MESPNVKITIPKRGKNAGVAIIEMMKETNNCHQRVEELAVLLGPVLKREDKQHFDDENPAFHNVNNIQ